MAREQNLSRSSTACIRVLEHLHYCCIHSCCSHINSHNRVRGHRTKFKSLANAVVYKQESRHKVTKSVLRAVLGRMQFTLQATRPTPHGASRLVQPMSAWLVKTRRAPSRHRRDARVYGHTTTAMHKLSTPPPPPCVRFHEKKCVVVVVVAVVVVVVPALYRSM